MRWFEKQRIEWIALCIGTVGHIRRYDITKQFQISVPQASKDLGAYRRLTRKWMLPKIAYNKSSKRYERVTSTQEEA